MILFVLLLVVFILLSYIVWIALSILQRGELLKTDKWLAHRWEKESIAHVFSTFSLAASASLIHTSLAIMWVSRARTHST